MNVIKGDATKLSGKLQEKYGWTKEEAEKRWMITNGNLTGYQNK